MPNVTGTTRAQTIFLRGFRQNPAGPPRADWPHPSILRRWLRRAAFRAALQSIQETLRFQADFHLANAATQAAHKLSAQDPALSTQDLNRIMRLAHMRQRFPAKRKLASPATFKLREEIKTIQRQLDLLEQNKDDSPEHDSDQERADWLDQQEQLHYKARLEHLQSQVRSSPVKS